MTVQEAITQGISRIRQPQWNEQAYVQLDLSRNPNTLAWHMKPHAILHDPITEAAHGVEPMRLFFVGKISEGDNWEQYVEEDND